MTKHDKNKTEIRSLLEKINKAWSKGNPDVLTEYFHEDLVILSPDLRRMGEGKAACIQSYKDFIAQAAVHEYKEHDFNIDVWGDTAVATYAFDITYEMNRQTIRERGHDLFVFTRKDKKWLAVWRMVIPSPSS